MWNFFLIPCNMELRRIFVLLGVLLILVDLHDIERLGGGTLSFFNYTMIRT